MPLNAKLEEVRAVPFAVGQGGVVSALLATPEEPPADQRPIAPESTPPARPRRPQTARTPRPRAAAARGSQAPAPPTPASFTGGAQRQVQVSIEVGLLARLTELAQETRLSTNALLVAVVHAGLPADAAAAARAILEEMRVAGDRQPQGPRLPTDLRDRLDELTRGAKAVVVKATRSDLVNGLLRAGMPADSAAARAIHDRYVKTALDVQEAALVAQLATLV